MLQRVFGREVTLVNSAREIAREVGEVLERKGIGNNPARGRHYSFLCTSEAESFVKVGARFCRCPRKRENVDISELEGLVDLNLKTITAAGLSRPCM